MTTIRRRRFLVLLLIPALVLPLFGCSGGGGGRASQEPDIETTESTGVIDTGEIGGEDLCVKSVWQESAPAEPEGNFTTTVSAEGAQLLFATDSSGDVRGLTVSIPGADTAQGGHTLTVNATSTAISLLMQTPGILAIDPSVAAARRSQLAALLSFPGLVSALAARLPSQPLREVVTDVTVSNLLSACVNEWRGEHTQLGTAAVDPDFCNDPGARFRVGLGDATSTDWDDYPLKLSNGGWRWLNVVVRDIRDDGHVLAPTPRPADTNPIAGAIPVSWGSVFTNTFGDPTVELDYANCGPSRMIARSEYWAIGPGWAPSKIDLPPSLQNENQPWGETVIHYLLCPFLDFAAGGSALLDYGPEAARLLWDLIKLDQNATDALEGMRSADDEASATAATINACFTFLGLIVAGGASSALVALLGTSAIPVAVTIGTLLAKGAVIFSVSNFSFFIITLFTYPRVAKVDVYISGDVDVIVDAVRHRRGPLFR